LSLLDSFKKFYFDQLSKIQNDVDGMKEGFQKIGDAKEQVADMKIKFR
jgi:hypothetical protein